MTVRLLEDFNGYRKGKIDLPHRIAIDLISKGYAVKISEQSVDKDAIEALENAKERDEPKE